MALDLVCFGNLSIDDVVHPDGTTQMGCFGGDAVYATLGASYWTHAVQCVAPIGKDFPTHHMELFARAGWDMRGLPRRDVPSIHYWVVYEYDGRRTWIFRSDPEDFYALSPMPKDIPDDFRDSRAFLILAMELDAQEQLVQELKGSGAMVALDPQEDYIAGNTGRILGMLDGLDIFTPSQVEVERLVGHQDYPKAARQLAGYGCKIIVIKLGGDGALIFDRDQDRFWKIPTYPAKVCDTTGAGDSFCGGFMATYVQSGDLYRSGLAGAVSASFAIEGFGLTHMLDVDPREARRRFDKLVQI